MTEQTYAPARALSVRHGGGERYEIAIRDHIVAVDQPVGDGGSDTAPTPVELFVASLAGCVAFYAGRYLTRHGLPRDGLAVMATYAMATDRPARISDVLLTVRPPDALPAHQRAGLRAVIEHCTVHNSLQAPPTIAIELAG
ncbi:MAG TPA: OsmC family protein [Micromonosporaceae bacterium]|jgi:uncharacterized OsmC-like protein|nr:OsmC family protein [Micromonosporaceae bacterium]